MGKIKLNLVSGAVVEKPLINAFRANNNSYVVLDNEINGSMGLPIILVCKLENNKLIKIADQGEWQVVKEYLKNIIAGNQIEFIKINNELMADDIYYTQLTLPVPSFDALKRAYNVEEVVADVNIMNVNVEPVLSNPELVATPVEPVVPQVEVPVVEVQPNTQNVNEPQLSSMNIPMPEPVAPSTPVIDIAPAMPTFDNVSAPLEPETPQVEESTVEVANVLNEIDMFKEQKEAFMQACENMFDALVQKFQKELENRK